MKGKKKWIIVAIITVLLAVLVGGTYAYWSWQVAANQRTTITLTYANDFSCSVAGGGDISNSDVNLAPTTCTNTNYAIKRVIEVTPALDGADSVSLNLWLNVVSMDAELRDSDYFYYSLTHFVLKLLLLALHLLLPFHFYMKYHNLYT